MDTKNLLMEPIMSDLQKADCIPVEKAQVQVGIVRNTLNAYLNALGIQRHKFPFDRKTYITLSDYERLKQFIDDNRNGDEV